MLPRVDMTGAAVIGLIDFHAGLGAVPRCDIAGHKNKYELFSTLE